MLSNADIERELGKNILIFPLIPDNIKGNTINLTASKLAWSLETKSSIISDDGKKLLIKANDTALIETEETIYVTNKIGGCYHSKVKLVSAGLGHIGTTLDPEYIGPSLIAIHNQSSDDYELTVGDSFVSLTLYYLHNKSTKVQTNTPGQPERLNSFNVSDVDKNWMDEEWRKDKVKLKYKLVSSDTYLNIKQKSLFNRIKPFFIYGLFFIIFDILVIFFSDVKNIELYYVALFGIVVGSVASDIRNWR